MTDREPSNENEPTHEADDQEDEADDQEEPVLTVEEEAELQIWEEEVAAKEQQTVWQRRGPALIGVALVVVVLAVFLTSRGDDKREVTGTLTLVDSDVVGDSDDCYGTGGYDDIESGAQVVVKDGAGKTIATGRLGAGEFDDELVTTCTLPFVVEVPNADFYSFSVSHRGELNYSREELEDEGWDVGLTLGL